MSFPVIEAGLQFVASAQLIGNPGLLGIAGYGRLCTISYASNIFLITIDQTIAEHDLIVMTSLGEADVFAQPCVARISDTQYEVFALDSEGATITPPNMMVTFCRMNNAQQFDITTDP